MLLDEPINHSKYWQKLNLNGLCDITLLANYNLLNKLTDTSTHRFNHNLLIGGGVKFYSQKKLPFTERFVLKWKLLLLTTLLYFKEVFE